MIRVGRLDTDHSLGGLVVLEKVWENMVEGEVLTAWSRPGAV